MTRNGTSPMEFRQTAREQLVPYEYIKDVLVRISTQPAAQLDELVPQHWTAPP